ncbi:MAG: hypothetical protein HC875_05150 [Anaerolineales bacterium]|nr:hypothetical protein [Anaerolineales bacterium]
MPSRPRPPRSEPVWQTLDPTNLPFNRMSEFDQPEPEPDEVFQGDEPAQTLAPAATGAESAPPSAKPSVQRQPDFEAPLQPEPSSLEMPLRLPQAEPDEVAQTIASSASEGEAAQPTDKPTVQRQPAVETPPQSEPPPVLEMPLRQVEPKAGEAAQGVEPSSIEPSAAEREAAQPPSKSTVQRQATFEAPLLPEPSSLEMPLRQPEPKGMKSLKLLSHPRLLRHLHRGVRPHRLRPNRWYSASRLLQHHPSPNRLLWKCRCVCRKSSRMKPPKLLSHLRLTRLLRLEAKPQPRCRTNQQSNIRRLKLHPRSGRHLPWKRRCAGPNQGRTKPPIWLRLPRP